MILFKTFSATQYVNLHSICLLQFHFITFLFIFRVSLTLSCPMTLELFPLDRQICHLRVASCKQNPILIIHLKPRYCNNIFWAHVLCIQIDARFWQHDTFLQHFHFTYYSFYFKDISTLTICKCWLTTILELPWLMVNHLYKPSNVWN